MRAPLLPSAEVDAAGRIYVAWHDCRFPPEDCAANDIVLASSRDGRAWTLPARVPTGEEGSSVDHFVPGLAVDPTTSGAKGRLAVAYYSMSQPCYPIPCRAIDAGFVSSRDGGRTWTAPQRLNAQSMPLTWIADSDRGRFLGDYISTSFVRGRAVPVFALASPPSGGLLRQAIFAATLPRGR